MKTAEEWNLEFGWFPRNDVPAILGTGSYRLDCIKRVELIQSDAFEAAAALADEKANDFSRIAELSHPTKDDLDGRLAKAGFKHSAATLDLISGLIRAMKPGKA